MPVPGPVEAVDSTALRPPTPWATQPIEPGLARRSVDSIAKNVVLVRDQAVLATVSGIRSAYPTAGVAGIFNEALLSQPSL